MRDFVRCDDGPLAGRRYYVEGRPSEVFLFEVAMSPEDRVLAVDGEPLPHPSHGWRSAQVVYEVGTADDGERSRDDEGLRGPAVGQDQRGLSPFDAARALREVLDEVEAGGQVLIRREGGGEVLVLNPHEHADIMAALDEAGSRGDRAAIATARWVETHRFGRTRPEDHLDGP